MVAIGRGQPVSHPIQDMMQCGAVTVLAFAPAENVRSTYTEHMLSKFEVCYSRHRSLFIFTLRPFLRILKWHCLPQLSAQPIMMLQDLTTTVAAPSTPEATKRYHVEIKILRNWNIYFKRNLALEISTFAYFKIPIALQLRRYFQL